MDQHRKLRLEEAIAASKAKGNERLAEAAVKALESDQAKFKNAKAA